MAATITRGDNGDDEGYPEAGIGSTKHNVANIVLEMHDEYQRGMHNDKKEKGDQAQEMQTARGLFAAKKLDVPGEASLDRGRHGRSGEDHERPQEEYDARVCQLL